MKRGLDPFYGQTKCNKPSCNNGAYWKIDKTNKYLCGVHSRKMKKSKLEKNPQEKTEQKQRLKEHNKSVELLKNKEGKGTITCFKMKMMKPVPLVEGVLNVFPNNRHENRTDGFGCAALSPMQLGPVKHGQKNLPDALSIENYHQFNKCFPNETDDENEITMNFYKKQLDAYKDPVPHRHKYKIAKIKTLTNGNTNIPLFSVHKDGNGKERRYTYIESRFFYCKWYEKLATQTTRFKKLQEMFNSGYNLCICGYDAYVPTDNLYKHYCDKSRPFGHELVLYCLLINEKPWEKYYEKHRELYDPLSF